MKYLLNTFIWYANKNKHNALKHESSSKLLVYILALLVLKNSLLEMEMTRHFRLLFLKCAIITHSNPIVSEIPPTRKNCISLFLWYALEAEVQLGL